MEDGPPSAMSDPSDLVVVELFGLARLRAGRSTMTVRPGTLAQLLLEVVASCPEMAQLLEANASERAGAFLISLNGERFLSDPGEAIAAGAHLLILGADAGG